ncbi:hypothetical protein ACJ72_03487 [Emergomyces africanus]|uniref:Uncharacterized protein n=1 Tax=Emergomyces africanus TaxID=1955775 RepID=A0A1B7NZH1_9EURO|nr:hypothetical protein ACJ72_03487 [Emergomyces africanus]
MSSQALTQPIPKSRTTTLHTRQTHCTHSTFTREFSSSDNLATCQMCKRGPDLGWVYACTEDKERLDARYASAQQQLSSSSTTVSTNTETGDVVRLNIWIEKAIEDGHYTPEQAELVKAQRATVLETIKTDNRVRRDSTPETQLHLSAQGTEGTEPAPEKAYVKVSSSALLPACHYGLDNVTIPMCCLRVCSGCMPIVTERSWESLDRVCKDTSMTNNRLSGILSDVIANIDSACMTIESRKVPTPEGSQNCDIVDMNTGGDVHQARASPVISPRLASENDDNDDKSDGNKTCYGDLATVVDRNPINKILPKRKSLRELFHLHRNHAKGSGVTGKKSHHGQQQGLCASAVDELSEKTEGMAAHQQQYKVSENTRPPQSNTAPPYVARRAEHAVVMQHHGNGIDG